MDAVILIMSGLAWAGIGSMAIAVMLTIILAFYLMMEGGDDA